MPPINIDLSNKNLANILADVQLIYQKMLFDSLQIYQKMLSDIVQLSKSIKEDENDNSNSDQKKAEGRRKIQLFEDFARKAQFLEDFVKYYINFLNALETQNKDRFEFHRRVFLSNLQTYKGLVKDNPNMDPRIIECVEQDVNENGAQNLRKSLVANNQNLTPTFLEEIQKIKQSESGTAPSVAIAHIATGTQVKDVKQKLKNVNESIEASINNDYLTPLEKFMFSLTQVKRYITTAKVYVEKQYYAQGLAEYSKGMTYLQNIDESYYNTNSYHPQLKHITNDRYNLYKSTLKNLQIDYADALKKYSEKLFEEKNYEELLTILERELSVLNEILEPDHIIFEKIATCHILLARVKKGTYQEAIVHYQSALSVLDKTIHQALTNTIIEEVSDLSCRLCITQGMDYLDQNNYKSAVASYAQAAEHIETLKKLTQPNNQNALLLEASLSSNLADLYMDQIVGINENDLDRQKHLYLTIISFLRQALSIYEMNPTHPESIRLLNEIKSKLLMTYNSFSTLLVKLKDFTGAIRDSRLALALAKAGSEQSLIEQQMNHLALAEILFLNHYFDQNEEDDELVSEEENIFEIDYSDDEVSENDESDVENNANAPVDKLEILDKDQRKRQKREEEDKIILKDIIKQYDEVIQILERLDGDDLEKFVKELKQHLNFDDLKKELNTTLDEVTESEIICYCMPFFVEDIQKIDAINLRTVITDNKGKLPEVILNYLKLINLALVYPLALSKNDDSLKENLQTGIAALLKSIDTNQNYETNRPYEKINLTNGALSGICLPQSNFNLARLDNIDLNKANLTKCKFLGASICNANLKDAVLTHADLINAVLDGSDLSGANLHFADLTFASCVGCNFTGTDLSQTCLANTQLYGAKFISLDSYINEATFSKVFSDLLKKYENHKQKDKLYDAIFDDSIAVLSKIPDSLLVLECIKEMREVLESIKNNNNNSNIDNSNVNLTNSHAAFFEPTNNINKLLQMLSEFQDQVFPGISQQLQ